MFAAPDRLALLTMQGQQEVTSHIMNRPVGSDITFRTILKQDAPVAGKGRSLPWWWRSPRYRSQNHPSACYRPAGTPLCGATRGWILSGVPWTIVRSRPHLGDAPG